MYDKVMDFHEKFGVDIAVPFNQQLLEKNFNLIKEEFAEAAEEMASISEVIQKDPHRNIDVLKARLTKELVDLLYVVYSTGISFGLPIREAIEEVQRSNMSKLDENGNVVRRADGKILKGAQYSPANIDQFF